MIDGPKILGDELVAGKSSKIQAIPRRLVSFESHEEGRISTGGGFVRASPKKPASRANRVTLGVARLSRSVGLLKHPKRKVRHGRRDGRDARARRLKFSPLSHATREQWESGKVDTRARGRAG